MSKNLLLEYRPFEAKTISEGVHDKEQTPKTKMVVSIQKTY